MKSDKSHSSTERQTNNVSKRRSFSPPINSNKLYYQQRLQVPKNMAYFDANFTNTNQYTASKNQNSDTKISPRSGFHIKYTPMQLYPKMLKVKVADKQLGKKF